MSVASRTRWKGWLSALPSLSVIDRRATYVSTPMMGLMPALVAAW